MRVAEDGSQENALVAVNLGNGQMYTVATTAKFWMTGYALSPDGKQVVFIEQDYPLANHWNIVLADLDGGQRSFIYQGEYEHWAPEGRYIPSLLGWSAHTNEIILWGDFRDPSRGDSLQTMHPETGRVRPIADQIVGTIGCLSLDGMHLVYLSYNPAYPPDNYVPQPGTPSNEIYLLDLTTVQSTTLLSEQSGRIFTSRPVFSADSKNVLIWRGRYEPGEPERPRAEELLVVSLDANVTVVDRPPATIQPYGDPVSCPDGGFLYAMCSNDGGCELRRVSIEPPQATSLPYRFDTRTWAVACLQ